MFRKTILSFVAIACLPLGGNLFGFALEGPAIGYETAAFGYEPNAITRHYPRNLGDEHRITVPNLFYSVDQTFLDYFGERGREEVGKMFDLFNELPPFSQMSDDLSEFPQVTYRQNFKADALLLRDLKSWWLRALLLDVGLTDPEYYMWSVRSRVLPNGRQCPAYQWVIIMRNFDPVSWEPSSYVNGTLYTFSWVLSCTPDLTTPAPVQVDPTAFGFSTVVQGSNIGQYFTGLSRDDIGGLRYIYRKSNYNVDTLPANVFTGGGGGVDWSIPDPNATNVVVNTTGLRTGIDKFTFEERPYDSLMSQLFIGFTNIFDSGFITNSAEIAQSFSRPVLVPDFLFSAADQVDTDSGTLGRSGTYYSNTTGAGPGSLDVGSGVPVTYTINKLGQAFDVDNPFYLTEPEIVPITFLRWGSFDGTTNDPVMYPNRASIEDAEAQVLGGQ